MTFIKNSTSCSTLIDVEDFKATRPSRMNETEIIVEDDNEYKHKLHIPLTPSESIDNCLRNNPLLSSTAKKALAKRSEFFLSKGTFSTSSVGKGRGPTIYVHQREVAHVSNEQYDNRGAILVSDSATTCHIIGVRSYSCCNRKRILGSLCHLDSIQNGTCVRKMIEEHLSFHKCLGKCLNRNQVHMEVHIIGGYLDQDRTSEETTSHILNILAKAAKTCRSKLEMKLKTCVVTGLNDCATYEDNVSNAPIIRGLALDISSGQVHLFNKVHEICAGPAKTLRRVRLWAPALQNNFLLEVHTWEKEEICVEPFEYAPFPDIELFLQLPDDTLLQYSSTSPECEADDFCDIMRITCTFVKDIPVSDVFGEDRKRIVYHSKKRILNCGDDDLFEYDWKRSD